MGALPTQRSPPPTGRDRIPEPRLDRGEIAPAVNVARREAANLVFAPLVFVPELDAAAVLERNEEPRGCRIPLEAVGGQVQLFDHQGMEQSDEVGARGDPVAGPGFVDRARSPHTRCATRSPEPAGPIWPGRPHRSNRYARHPPQSHPISWMRARRTGPASSKIPSVSSVLGLPPGVIAMIAKIHFEKEIGQLGRPGTSGEGEPIAPKIPSMHRRWYGAEAGPQPLSRPGKLHSDRGRCCRLGTVDMRQVFPS